MTINRFGVRTIFGISCLWISTLGGMAFALHPSEHMHAALQECALERPELSAGFEDLQLLRQQLVTMQVKLTQRWWRKSAAKAEHSQQMEQLKIQIGAYNQYFYRLGQWRRDCWQQYQAQHPHLPQALHLQTVVMSTVESDAGESLKQQGVDSSHHEELDAQSAVAQGDSEEVEGELFRYLRGERDQLAQMYLQQLAVDVVYHSKAEREKRFKSLMSSSGLSPQVKSAVLRRFDAYVLILIVQQQHLGKTKAEAFLTHIEQLVFSCQGLALKALGLLGSLGLFTQDGRVALLQALVVVRKCDAVPAVLKTYLGYVKEWMESTYAVGIPQDVTVGKLVGTLAGDAVSALSRGVGVLGGSLQNPVIRIAAFVVGAAAGVPYLVNKYRRSRGQGKGQGKPEKVESGLDLGLEYPWLSELQEGMEY
ncbi:MAG: hypothetical protein OXT67_13585 [Zetaproteobacteria bacterium]|nr:hypothetical protein [Zetaproteobacteria bacterium]